MKKHNFSTIGLKSTILSLAAALSPFLAPAETFPRSDRLSPLVAGYMERAEIMLHNGNYAGVIDQLKHIDSPSAELSQSERQQYAYMLAMALYQRGDSDCVDILRQFADSYPASTLALQARLAAADYFFFAHHFNKALPAYDEIDFSLISPALRPTYTYRKALSMTRCGLFNEARPLFESLADNRKFSIPAKYYLAYLDYVAGDYGKALEAFRNVENLTDENPHPGIFPLYYITQIEYSRGEFSKVTEDGIRLLKEEPDDELTPETERIVGLSFFKLGEMEKAGKYLEKYVAHKDVTPADDAVYALAVIDYRDGNLSAAANKFATLTDLENDLAQSAYLYLGQIAVRQDEPSAAAISFEKAAKMSFDPNVTEVALYNYIAALTHGGNTPFSSCIPLLSDFIRQFPRSEYAPEVREYLATAYFNEKNYPLALESINKIPSPSKNVMAAKQKILYELGMESMANNKPEYAYKYLKEATEISGDPTLRTQSYLWLGDALYALSDFKAAEQAYTNFLRNDPHGGNSALARYNLAYSRLMQDKYSGAATGFKNALDSRPALPQRLRDDAMIRMADALYYSGRHGSAIKYYSEAIDANAADADYATFRRAVMYGLDGDIGKKLSELDALPHRFPGSPWIPNALLEQGQTYSGIGKTSEAVKAFEKLESSYQQNALARKGMLSMAITLMQTQDTSKAEHTYKEIIRKWPTSEEATLANDDLLKFYSSHGGLQEYAQFLQSVPNAPRIDSSEMETLAFEGAETAFAEDAANTGLLEKYISEYPDGRYLAQALLDVATGHDEAGNKEGALTALESLLSLRPDSRQVPEALLLKAQILEEYGTAAARQKAVDTFRELEARGDSEYLADARTGIMRNTDNDAERIRYATIVKNTSGIPADLVEEAEFYEASSRLRNGDIKAADTLSRLAENPRSLYGARAAVSLGQYYLDSGILKKAEKILTSFTDDGTPHQYWLARGFIALADVCHKSGKDYLAVEYLKSLKENYPGTELDIHDMISSRLSKWK